VFSISLGELVDRLGAKLEGDPHCLVSGIATLENASAGQISFLTSPRYRKFLSLTRASAVIVGTTEDALQSPVSTLIVRNPRASLGQLSALFEEAQAKPVRPGIHPTTVIGLNAQIPSSVSIAAQCVLGDDVCLGEHVVIGPGCSIGNACVIQAGTTLKAHVTLYDNTRIGQKCLLHSGAVIGADGFGFEYEEGKWVKLHHLGGVLIGDRVEIGANTTIDRGFVGDTQIGEGVIIDNLVQIAHNVIIGRYTAIAACTAVAGSTVLGEACMIGGAARIAGHVVLADRVIVTATTSVNHSLNTPGTYSAVFPAKPSHIWRRNAARFYYLDDMAKRLRVLEKQVHAVMQKTEEE